MKRTLVSHSLSSLTSLQETQAIEASVWLKLEHKSMEPLTLVLRYTDSERNKVLILDRCLPELCQEVVLLSGRVPLKVKGRLKALSLELQDKQGEDAISILEQKCKLVLPEREKEQIIEESTPVQPLLRAV